MTPLQQIQAAIDHLHHVLPGQGPILDFVHENTLEGFQYLPFRQALIAYEAMTGVRGYMSESRFRDNYKQGRISDADLNEALDSLPGLTPDTLLGDKIRTGDIYAVALKYPLPALNQAQLQWQLGREKALTHWQKDLPDTRKSGNPPARVLPALWQHILDTLNIDASLPDPDAAVAKPAISESALSKITKTCVENLVSAVGDTLSLGGLVKCLTSHDILNDVAPVMLRLSSSLLDEGTAAWHLGDNHYTSLFHAWRASLHQDSGLALDGLPLKTELINLPVDAEDAIIYQLEALQLPRTAWNGYLQRLCLEVPGWTGLINWRQRHPKYHCDNPLQPHLRDWLAIC